MQKLIIANWKMHPTTVAETVALAKAEDRTGVVIAPPFPFLSAVARSLRRACLGAQDAFWSNSEDGACTGEVSLGMLRNFRVRYVLIGHSERRRIIGETEEIIGKKLDGVFRAGLTPVLCVGEDAIVRRKGIGAARRFVGTQLKKHKTALRRFSRRDLVIAYEPLWAIGTGVSDSPSDACEMAAHIRSVVRWFHPASSMKILYGGSVTSRNAADFIRCSGIDGALVGGASIHAEEFRKIIQCVL